MSIYHHSCENEWAKHQVQTLEKMNHASGMDKVQPTITPSSPYYLGAFNNLGTLLVVVAFIGDNYCNWARSIKTALRAKTKLGFIDGSIKKPLITSPKFNYLEKVNLMVIAWIINSTNPTFHGKSRVVAKKGKEARSEVRATFHVANSNRRRGCDDRRSKYENCGKLGHEKAKCFELIGYPPNWNTRRASHHITLLCSILKEVCSLDEPLYITVPTSDVVMVKEIENMNLNKDIKLVDIL
ncbi:hypothetical protein CR513_24859, partial [Mucuna pruriens]